MIDEYLTVFARLPLTAAEVQRLYDAEHQAGHRANVVIDLCESHEGLRRMRDAALVEVESLRTRCNLLADKLEE